MTKERCPLCEEDINVGTAGPMGLAQHRGKKKCLATVKRKKQDAVIKKPTLLSYLRRQEKGSSSATNLAREAERNSIEDAARILVSQIVTTKAVPRVSTTQRTEVHDPP